MPRLSHEGHLHSNLQTLINYSKLFQSLHKLIVFLPLLFSLLCSFLLQIQYLLRPLLTRFPIFFTFFTQSHTPLITWEVESKPEC